MGTYCTTTSLDTIMVGLNFDTATTALAGKAITHAESEIKKYLSKRYDLTAAYFQTSTSTPPLVQSWCEDLSESYIWHRSSRSNKETRQRAMEIRKEVLDNLKDVRDYKMDLYDSTGSIITDLSNTAYRVKSTTRDYHDTFDEGSPLSWFPDEDKLDDISDDKD